jgi:hypothetical protein
MARYAAQGNSIVDLYPRLGSKYPDISPHYGGREVKRRAAKV